jgi:hypothetical protein
MAEVTIGGNYYKVVNVARSVEHKTEFSVIYESLAPSILRDTDPPIELPIGTVWYRELNDFLNKFVTIGKPAMIDKLPSP